MSRTSLAVIEDGMVVPCDEQRQAALGRLANVAFLKRYMEAADKELGPQDPGSRIDHGLVEYVSTQLSALDQGVISIEEFKSNMHQVEEGMRENTALKTLAATLRNDRVPVPPASETYLKLAKLHALYGGKPLREEGGRFARALLAYYMDEAFWETDWNRRAYARIRADIWLHGRDPGGLQALIDVSWESEAAWDALQMICQVLANRREVCPPYELLEWHFRASHDDPKRPDEGPGPSHRPNKFGYKVRDNEIRHTVELMTQVGMPKTAALETVSAAVHLGLRTIQAACRKPYATVFELTKGAMKIMEPSFYAYLFEGKAPAFPCSCCLPTVDSIARELRSSLYGSTARSS